MPLLRDDGRSSAVDIPASFKMAGNQLCSTITSLVRDQALQAGPVGSQGYNDVLKAAVADLRAKASCLSSEIAATGGRQVLSVSAGESVTYTTPSMTQQDLLSAYNCAIYNLNGTTVPVWRRTTARYIY